MDNSREIDKVRDDFEAAWQAGGAPPQLPMFLNRIDTSQRDDLLLPLVQLDVAYRRSLGLECKPEDYASLGILAVRAAQLAFNVAEVDAYSKLYNPEQYRTFLDDPTCSIQIDGTEPAAESITETLDAPSAASIDDSTKSFADNDLAKLAQGLSEEERLRALRSGLAGSIGGGFQQ